LLLPKTSLISDLAIASQASLDGLRLPQSAREDITESASESGVPAAVGTLGTSSLKLDDHARVRRRVRVTNLTTRAAGRVVTDWPKRAKWLALLVQLELAGLQQARRARLFVPKLSKR